MCTGTVSPRGMHTSKTRTRSFSNILRWCSGAATKASKLVGQCHSDDKSVLSMLCDVPRFMQDKRAIFGGSFRFCFGLRFPDTVCRPPTNTRKKT